MRHQTRCVDHVLGVDGLLGLCAQLLGTLPQRIIGDVESVELGKVESAELNAAEAFGDPPHYRLFGKRLLVHVQSGEIRSDTSSNLRHHPMEESKGVALLEHRLLPVHTQREMRFVRRR